MQKWQPLINVNLKIESVKFTTRGKITYPSYEFDENVLEADVNKCITELKKVLQKYGK